MKTFKEYIKLFESKTKKQKRNLLSWESSFAEMRGNQEPPFQKRNILSWPSSFAEIRNKSLNEESSSDYYQETPNLGSNPGGRYRNRQTGKDVYIKLPFANGQHKAEEASAAVSSAIGIKTLNPKATEFDGKDAVISDWNPDVKSLNFRHKRYQPATGVTSLMQHPTQGGEHALNLAKLHHASVITTNMDATGYSFDNIMQHNKTGEIYSGDQGGSFTYGDRGDRKEYTPDIKPLIEGFQNTMYRSGAVFSQVPHEAMVEAAKHVRDNLTDDKIDKIVKDSDLDSTSPGIDHAAVMKKRRDALLEHYGVSKSDPMQVRPEEELAHDHPDIAPQNLSEEHKKAIFAYTKTPSEDEGGFASSSNVNNYLRNRKGDKTRTVLSHEPEAVEQAVKTLSSAFTTGNTNRKPIVAYTGIPDRIGNKLTSYEPNTPHEFAGFTSTTTDKTIAERFAEKSASKNKAKTKHVIVMHVEPGAGLSVIGNSGFENEKEVVLNHGAHATYHGHTVVPDQYGDGSTVYHHMTIHNTSTPLSEYKPYSEEGKDDFSSIVKNASTQNVLSALDKTTNPEHLNLALKHPAQEVREKAGDIMYKDLTSKIDRGEHTQDDLMTAVKSPSPMAARAALYADGATMGHVNAALQHHKNKDVVSAANYTKRDLERKERLKGDDATEDDIRTSLHSRDIIGRATDEALAAARHKNITPELLDLALEKPYRKNEEWSTSDLRAAAAGNPKLHKDKIKSLLSDDDYNVSEAAAKNPTLTKDDIKDLIHPNADIGTTAKLLQNPNVDSDVLLHTIKSHTDFLDYSPRDIIRHPAANKEILDTLANHEDYNIARIAQREKEKRGWE